MTLNSIEYENCLNIHLISFSLPESIIKEEENIRVSITSLPEDRKQYFVLEGKKQNNVNHIFSINITNETKKIIMVFRKNMVFKDSPIIASTSIHLEDFKEWPKKKLISKVIDTEIKTIDIFNPLQQQIKKMLQNGEQVKKHMPRKVIGHMEVKLSFTESIIPLAKSTKYDCKNNNLSKKVMRHKNKYEYQMLVSADSFFNPYELEN